MTAQDSPLNRACGICYAALGTTGKGTDPRQVAEFMFFLQKPTFDQLKNYLWRFESTPFTYPDVGATRSDAPVGYTVGRRRIRLGQGVPAFLEAKRLVADWKMFPPNFVDLVWPCAPQAGRIVATLFRAPGFWTLNPCKIVYTFDESEHDNERFGFAYGTVGDHLASGEERFSVEFDRRDDSVWYEVYCFSKARHWSAKIAYPYLRVQQIRFRRLSCMAMRDAVAAATSNVVHAH